MDTFRSTLRGGRAAAEAALAAIDPAKYTLSRNYLDGAVTQLSPYLRHGVLTLAEVRDHAIAVVRKPEDAEKFINELGWRDYWQRLYFVLGDGVWKDREPYKTGFNADSYAAALPEALLSGTTGLRCMDSFSEQLRGTGYLHNHARMWMAAYIVHWLRIRWQAGARWFLQHLLDGDPASNNLSWQWVASTFSNKPYFFNRENLERYTAARYCRGCALRSTCPFEGSYEDLEAKQFPHGMHAEGPLEHTQGPPAHSQQKIGAGTQALSRPLVWVHTGSLNPKHELLARFPSAPACFVWDEAWLREEQIDGKRTTFLQESLDEMPPRLQVLKEDIVEALLGAASRANADHFLAQSTPDPRLLAAAWQLERTLPVVWVDPPPFIDDSRVRDLKRFSRYWQSARFSALQPTRR